jgi:uncharacterized protein (DUF2249 family)/hemerythrin-like domain-containing protein
MEREPRELDVRPLAPSRRHDEILRAFDALAPEEAFVLVVDHYPKPFLYQLQAERRGEFEWNLLERGPELCRVGIVRRRDRGPRTVSEYLQGDHRRLDAIVADAERLLSAGDADTAARRFAEFRCGLDHHIDMEEFVLFPAFVRVTGMEGGPTLVMKDEHRQIRRHLEDATRALAEGSSGRFTAALRAMKAVLVEHNMKEEQILYPATDDGLPSDRERDDLVKQMQAY